jgi:PAS domain S-box-containing protein
MQQQQLAHQQQIQQQQQQQQIQQQQMQQQHQMQMQQQHHQQVTAVQQSQQAQPQQQAVNAPVTAQQQPQVAQQAAAVAPTVAHPGGFSMFQQGALLAQSQTNKQQPHSIQAMMMPNVAQSQDQRTDQHANPQFAFAADPSSFLRQLQVAQLQQQFNAAQQGRPLTQQAIGTAAQTQVAPGLQQQFQAQVPMVPTVPAMAAKPHAVAPKKTRAPSQKKLPATQKKISSRQTKEGTLATSKAPMVSASDTDGELSAKVGSIGSKTMTKTESFDELEARKKLEIDTSNMTPAEKAKANRDRNREHARNTRLRKKAYLEKLKSTVDDLCRERDTLVSESAGAANILVEMHNTRTEVLMSFFALRSANEKRRELWASILDESCFACVMPVTPYRSFPASEVQVSKCQRTILGIDGMMSDTSSLHVLLNSLVDRSRFPNANIVFRYTLVTEEAVVAGNQMMARWVMTTLNATQCGARMEVAKQGMLCCKFNSAHKIIGLELMFDVMALMLQLKQSAGSDTFSVIPNTVQTCQRSFDKPMVMTLAEEPYTIVQVNKLWEDMTGYKAEQVVGKASCRILEGEETDSTAVEGLMNEIRFKRPASAMVLHYKKSGDRFRNFFLNYPLSTDSRITHYLSLSSHIDTVMAGKTPNETMSIQEIKQGVFQGPSSSTSGAGQLSAPPLPTTAQAQPNFYTGIQSLPGSVGAGHLSLGQPAAQPNFALPPVLSSSHSISSAQTSMLPPALGAPNAMHKYSLGNLKREYSSDNNAAEPRKQLKTETVDS